MRCFDAYYFVILHVAYIFNKLPEGSNSKEIPPVDNWYNLIPGEC